MTVVCSATLARLERRYGHARELQPPVAHLVARCLAITDPGVAIVDIGDSRAIAITTDGRETLHDLTAPLRPTQEDTHAPQAPPDDR